MRNMRTIFLLVMAMLKGNGLADLAGDTTKKKKTRLSGKGSIIILIIAGLYMGGISVAYVISGFDALKPFGLEPLILGIIVSLIAFLVFFFGLFYVMSVFYFSRDVEKLLPLPVTPGELIMAKFLVTLAYEYLITLVLLAPAMVTYGVMNQSGVLFYLYMVVALILLPVAPLVLASILIMLIMRFAPAARNKDRFTLVASIFALVVGFGFSFGMQALMSNSSGSDFNSILSQSVDRITRISSGIFPGTYFVNYALSKPEGWDSFGMMLIFTAITVLSGVILYLAGNLLYFKGVIGISSSSSRGKKLSKSEFEKSTVSGSAFITYMKKDLKVLFRTPIFFMNNVIMNFLMPLFLIFPIAMGSSESEGGISIAKIRDLAGTVVFTGDLKIASYVLAGVFGLISFTCGVNGISESAISREGNCAYLMKIIPMSYKHQIWAKISAGILLSTAGAILTVAIAAVVAAPPFWFILLCIAVIPGAVLFPNISGILFDLYMPKIKWDNEQKAVKQNMNVLYGMCVSFLMIALMVVPIAAFDIPFILAAIYLTVMPVILAVAAAFVVNKNVNKTMLLLAA